MKNKKSRSNSNHPSSAMRSHAIGHRQVFPSAVWTTMRLAFLRMGRRTVTVWPRYRLLGSWVTIRRAPACSFRKGPKGSKAAIFFGDRARMKEGFLFLGTLRAVTLKSSVWTRRSAHALALCSPSRGWRPRW